MWSPVLSVSTGTVTVAQPFSRLHLWSYEDFILQYKNEWSGGTARIPFSNASLVYLTEKSSLFCFLILNLRNAPKHVLCLITKIISLYGSIFIFLMRILDRMVAVWMTIFCIVQAILYIWILIVLWCTLHVESWPAG